MLPGYGDGTFEGAVDFSVGSQPLSVAVGDFNADRKLDLAMTNLSSNTVSVLIND